MIEREIEFREAMKTMQRLLQPCDDIAQNEESISTPHDALRLLDAADTVMNRFLAHCKDKKQRGKFQEIQSTLAEQREKLSVLIIEPLGGGS